MKKLIKYIVYKIVSTRQEYRRATKADDLCKFIWEYQQYLRSQWKYGNPPDDIDKMYDKWFEMIDDNDINLDNIYS